MNSTRVVFALVVYCMYLVCVSLRDVCECPVSCGVCLGILCMCVSYVTSALYFILRVQGGEDQQNALSS